MNDDNEEMFYGISTDFTRKVTGIFHNNWWKTIDNFVDTDTEYGTWYCSWYWRGGKENEQKPTTLVANSKQYEEVLSENVDSNSAEEADTELEHNADTDTEL